jgi:hypothetical protein
LSTGRKQFDVASPSKHWRERIGGGVNGIVGNPT